MVILDDVCRPARPRYIVPGRNAKRVESWFRNGTVRNRSSTTLVDDGADQLEPVNLKCFCLTSFRT